MAQKRVYLYAFDKLHKLEDCKFLEGDVVTVRNIKSMAEWMMSMNPSVRNIYAIDNRPGLYREFMETTKTKDFVKHIEFEDEVSHEGILVAIGRETV